MKPSHTAAWVAGVALFLFAAAGWWSYASIRQQLAAVETQKAAMRTSTLVLHFARLFVDKVLTQGNVSFEERLQLENAVRDTKDEELLKLWSSFLESKTEAEAQEKVKALLTTLLKKIQ